MITIAIHQPNFLPYPGFFAKMLLSDIFVLLDTVQFVKNEWQNRNRIRTPSGWQYLTVPIHHRFPQKIMDVEIVQELPWRRKHLNALKTYYGKAPFFMEIYSKIKESYAKEWKKLTLLNEHLIRWCASRLEFQGEIVRASELPITTEERQQRLLDICRHFGAKIYLSGSGARSYVDRRLFQRAGVTVQFLTYHTPPYPQCFSGFVPNLSILDLLFNNNNKRSREIVIQGSLVE